MEAFAALATLLSSPQLLGLMAVAVVVGMVFGAVPGVGGKTAIVLEQRFPLEGDDLPVPGINVAGAQADKPARPEFAAAGGQSGRVSFPVALAHPVMEGLTERDFFTWAGDEMTFRLSYGAPSSGAIALVQAGRELGLAPMLDIPVGRGRYVLSQVLIGEKLGQEPVAGRLLGNMLAWAMQRSGIRGYNQAPDIQG